MKQRLKKQQAKTKRRRKRKRRLEILVCFYINFGNKGVITSVFIRLQMYVSVAMVVKI